MNCLFYFITMSIFLDFKVYHSNFSLLRMLIESCEISQLFEID